MKLNIGRIKVCQDNNTVDNDAQQPQNNKHNELCKTSFHSLFYKQIPAKKTTTTLFELMKKSNNNVNNNEINTNNTENAIITLELEPAKQLFTLYLGDFNEDITTDHYKIINTLKSLVLPNDTLELYINSFGGYLDEGIFFIHHLKEIFGDDIVVYIDTCAYSMGAFLFSFFNNRIIYEYSKIMFHDYTTKLSGRSIEIDKQFEILDKDSNNLIYNLVEKKFITTDEYNDLKKGVPIWLNSLDMAKRQICTHVIVEQFCITANDFVEYKTQLLNKEINTIEEYYNNKYNNFYDIIQDNAEKNDLTVNNIDDASMC